MSHSVKQVNVYASTDNELAMCDDLEGTEAVRKRKMKTNVSPIQCQALPKHKLQSSEIIL
jgi:hypothetical protein